VVLALLATACGGSDSTGPVPVSDVILNRTTAQLAVGDSVLLTASMRDADGNTLTGRDVDWTSTNGSVASVSNAGWVKALQSGTTTITATSESITAQAQITVSATPVVASVSPALLTPGIVATITGTGFSATPAQNAVRIAGSNATVTSASATELTVTVPAAGQLPCAATHAATVSVAVAGVSGSTTHPLQVATQRTLNAGDALTFASAAEARCNEFSQTGGRYFVAVHRPDNSLAATSSFQVKGEAATTASARVIPAVELPRPSLLSSGGRTALSPFAMVSEARQAEQTRRHRDFLDENLRLAQSALGQVRRSRQSAGAPSFSRSRASFAIATVGDTSDIKIPNRNLTGNTCTSAPINVRARTVYSGTRAIILEDIASPTNGQIDSWYQDLGQEFDNVMYPIVTANFGDPLAYDAALDNNGKLLMLFSKQINDFGGILGFVTSCDFLDIGSVPTAIASNEAEIFYAIAPNTTGTGFDGDNSTYTAAEWRRTIRATLIHEAKHLAMFAERFASPVATTFETSWLEEGMAMHSEELYSRTITGAAWKANTGYGSQAAQNHIWCELRPSTCADRPFIMTSHFAFLYDYLTNIESKTIVGSVPVGSSDGSYYGSSWAFVRWMLDAHAANEGAVLRALTVEPNLTGAENLAARTGVPFETMLPQFHYALQYDDVAGITPTAAWQHIQSWNTRAIFGGLNTDLPTSFLADFLQDRPVQFGAFTLNVNALRGGSAAHIEISGAQAAKQLIALQAQNGGAPDPLLRMTVYRVQ
jgi:hypothetical protein